jgi:hypothetical protein
MSLFRPFSHQHRLVCRPGWRNWLDAGDLKSPEGNLIWVRFPVPAFHSSSNTHGTRSAAHHGLPDRGDRRLAAEHRHAESPREECVEVIAEQSHCAGA